MHFSTLLTLAAAPLISAWSCLSDADAQDIVDKSIIFLQHRNITEARAVATELFDPDIVQYGDSINILRADPLGTPVYENATAYIEGTLAAPGIPNVSQHLPKLCLLPVLTIISRSPPSPSCMIARPSSSSGCSRVLEGPMRQSRIALGV